MSQSIFAKTIKDERLGEMISPYQKALLEAYTPIVDPTKSMGENTTVLEDPITKEIHYVMVWSHKLGEQLETAYDVLEYQNINIDELEKRNREMSEVCNTHKYDPAMEKHGGV